MFVFAEFGVEGQGEDLGGGAFGFGKVSGVIAEGCEGGLLVEAEGIVDFGADRFGGEVGSEVVAAGGADDVLVEDVLGAGVGVGQDDAGGPGVLGRGEGGDAGGEEELVVAGGEVAAALVPGGQVAEFDLEDGGLEGVESGVPADFVVEVAARHAVGAEGAGAGVEGGGAGGDEAGVAEGGEVFSGVEAEGGGVAEGACGDGVPGGAEGLGGVLDEQEAGMLELEGDEGVEVGALTVEVNGEDGLDVGAAGEDLGGGGGGEVEGEGVDVGEEGNGAGTEDGGGGGEEAEGGGDDELGFGGCVGEAVVADAGGRECEPEGVGAAGAADGVGGGAGEGGGGFEGGDLGAEDELLRSEGGLEGLHDFVADEGELAREVKHGDGLRHLGMVHGWLAWADAKE